MSDWAYPGDSQALFDEGWSAPPLVPADGEWVEVEGPYGPTFWSQMLDRALAPARPAPVVVMAPPIVQQDPVPLWALGLGAICIAVVIRSFR